MNVKTLPRTVLAIEYAALRRPVALVENLLVGRLDTEDPRRLGFERTLGQVDAFAGRWLDDTELTSRGEHAQAHADAVTKAQRLSVKARQTRTEADAALKRATAAADKQRTQAVADHEREVLAAAKQEGRQKAEATKQAKARAAAEKAAIADQAQQKVAAAANKQRTRSTAADKDLRAATAAPKAALADAQETAKDAAGQLADADRLAQLAETEKKSRQN